MTAGPPPIAAMRDAQTALGRFAALVMADEALANTLNAEQSADQFAKLAIDCAAARGIALDPGDAFSATRPDPLGIGRWTVTPTVGSNWPGKDWLPIQVVSSGDRIYVDWAHFGATPLTEPFYEDSIRRALSRPFSRMFRYRMTIDDFIRHAESERSLAPNGFIFHMSRCGSTLAAQMLAAMPDNTVISEAAPIDAMVQISRATTAVPAERHAWHLRAMVAALGCRRAGNERHYVIKFDSWHALALPLFARAFPGVPWVFLYRDPVDVLVSQMRERGTQMIPEIVPPSLYGIDDFSGIPDMEYCARVLSRICGAAIDHHAAGGGLLVNYRELPDAVFTKILPHFGLACDDGEREIMRRAARYDAKSPQFEFADDTETKQRQATIEIRAVTERHVGAAYRRLEALRIGAA